MVRVLSRRRRTRGSQQRPGPTTRRAAYVEAADAESPDARTPGDQTPGDQTPDQTPGQQPARTAIHPVTPPATPPDGTPPDDGSARAGGPQGQTETDRSIPRGMLAGGLEAPDADLPVLSAAAELDREVAARGFLRRHRVAIGGAWLSTVIAGVACLVVALTGAGPTHLDELGSIVVLTAFAWALAARTGGRPLVSAGVAAVAAVAGLASGEPALRSGVAVMTCAVSAVLAVVATVPVTTYRQVAREVAVAASLAVVGAVAAVGLAPSVSLVRFEYAVLALALVGTFAVVLRLGAGFHGLGRRGVLAVVVGAALLLAILLYAEALRRYGPAGAVDGLLDVVRTSRDRLGAFPRPIAALLGVPALAWGVHLRSRRRQGWWVCAFGAAGTASFASALVNPATSLLEGGLSVVYGALIGLAIGMTMIRLDLALAGGGAGGARGAGRRADDLAAARPEPGRSASLI